MNDAPREDLRAQDQGDVDQPGRGEKLRARYEKLEATAAKLQAEKDEALAKLYEKYGDRLREANDKAAAAQKEWLDYEAARALLDRPDGESVATALGLTLPG